MVVCWRESVVEGEKRRKAACGGPQVYHVAVEAMTRNVFTMATLPASPHRATDKTIAHVPRTQIITGR